jgi:hypothetical protein
MGSDFCYRGQSVLKWMEIPLSLIVREELIMLSLQGYL